MAFLDIVKGKKKVEVFSFLSNINKQLL